MTWRKFKAEHAEAAVLSYLRMMAALRKYDEPSYQRMWEALRKYEAAA